MEHERPRSRPNSDLVSRAISERYKAIPITSSVDVTYHDDA